MENLNKIQSQKITKISKKNMQINKKKLSGNITNCYYDAYNNKNTIVNCVCFCSECFNSNDKLLYILPCCHIIHENCFNDYILKSQYEKFYTGNLKSVSNNEIINQEHNSNSKNHLNCPYCNTIIKTVLSEYKINSKKKYSQYKTDLKSLKIDNSASINYMTLPLGMVKLTSLMNKLISVNAYSELLSTIEYLLSSLNIKINIIDNTNLNPIIIKNNCVSWVKNEDNNRKLVIISNHAHYIDSIVIYYLFRCGFVSSDFINQTDIGKIIATKLKLLIFKRGVDTNMVEKIKKYLDEQKRIAIFPEGKITNNDTMIRFRTGAFYVDEAICPIVIKYDNIAYDDDFKKMLFKVITQNEIGVNIYINDFFYPPFDTEKIEAVRDYMCSVGNFSKSRVSNKSIKE